MKNRHRKNNISSSITSLGVGKINSPGRCIRYGVRRKTSWSMYVIFENLFPSLCSLEQISPTRHRYWKAGLFLCRNVRKGPICRMRTAEVQISMRICAVWSEPWLSENMVYNIQLFCRRTSKAQIRLRGCAVWSGHSLSAELIKAIFLCRNAFILEAKWLYHLLSLNMSCTSPIDTNLDYRTVFSGMRVIFNKPGFQDLGNMY